MMPRDPSSPTAVEQGFGQVPCPPSTNSSTSARNDAQGNGVFGGKGPSLQGVQNVGGGICNPGMSPMMQGNVRMPVPMMGSPPGFQCEMPSGSCLQPEGANLSGSSFQPGAYCQNHSFSSCLAFNMFLVVRCLVFRILCKRVVKEKGVFRVARFQEG